MKTGPLILALAVVASVAADDPEYRPEVREAHPEIVLPRIDTGQQDALSRYRGKKVLLVHFASW